MPGPLLQDTVEVMEERHVHVPPHPLTFDEYVDLLEDTVHELVGGNLVEKMAAELDHEKLVVWLLQVVGVYVAHRHLGIVLGSRTAVKIHEFGGRLPDVVFVRQERTYLVQQKGIYGPPDLVVEVISPGDRLSETVEKEAEYRVLGTAEIWQIDPKRSSVTVLVRRNGSYDQTTITDGPIEATVIDGLALRAEWLLEEPRPDPLDVISALLGHSAEPG